MGDNATTGDPGRADKQRVRSGGAAARHRGVNRRQSLGEVVQREFRNTIANTAASVSILDELRSHGFSREEISELVVPRRTLARRRQSGELLSREESDRAVRLARITELAERVFGDDTKAHRWLRKRSPMLEGAIPLDLLKSETGAQLVEQTLHGIDYGMFA
jgi:putative toxin-antitoxin system antitoxin component (TIGR02293 family)